MREFVAFIAKELDKKSASAINIPEWAGISVGIVFDTISKVTGVQFPINRERVEKFCSSTEIDSQNAFETGFAATNTIKDALHVTVQGYIRDSY